MKIRFILALTFFIHFITFVSAQERPESKSLEKAGFDDQTLYRIGYVLKHITPVTSELNSMTIKCLLASVESGNSEAMLQLGEMYLAGRMPLEKGQDSNTEAIKWWNLAWEHGCTRAYHNMGLLYYGISVPGTGGAGSGIVGQDYDKAFQYFKAAADLNDTKAIRYTGICYENGQGIKQDFNEAAKYYQMIGGYYLANLLLEGKGIAQDVNKAIEIYQDVASKNGGGSEGQYAAEALGRIYEQGLYVEPDINKSLKYYQLAADKGSSDAILKLNDYAAGLYKEGYALLTAGNFESAFPLILKSAYLGNPNALKITGIEKK